MKLIHVIGYPSTFQFECDGIIKTNSDRTIELHKFMYKNKHVLSRTFHGIEDFVVEDVEKIGKSIEIWHLGS